MIFHVDQALFPYHVLPFSFWGLNFVQKSHIDQGEQLWFQEEFTPALLWADPTDNILKSYKIIFIEKSNLILINGNCVNWALQINLRQIEEGLESALNSILSSKINKE